MPEVLILGESAYAVLISSLIYGFSNKLYLPVLTGDFIRAAPDAIVLNCFVAEGDPVPKYFATD